jgi:hypothetical protein
MEVSQQQKVQVCQYRLSASDLPIFLATRMKPTNTEWGHVLSALNADLLQ